MKDKRIIRLNDVRIANYKQSFYDRMNKITYKLNYYNRLSERYINDVDCINDLLYKIDRAIKLIEIEISNLDSMINDNNTDFSANKNSGLNHLDYQYNTENSFNFCEIRKNVLEEKMIIFIEKRYYYLSKLRLIKKNMKVVKRNIKICEKNAVTMATALEKFDYNCTNGVNYISSQDINPKIKELKKLKKINR